MPQMSQSHTGSTHLLHHIYGKPGREPSAEEGLPGCCSDDAQVSSVSTPSSRWSSGATAGRTGVQLYPHRFRHHLNHTGLNRGGAEGDVMQLRPWRGRQDRAVNIGARLCPRLPTPFDGDIAIAGSCGSPAYAPSCQTMRHRISVEGRFVNVVMTWARCSAVSAKRLTRRNAHGRDSWPK